MHYKISALELECLAKDRKKILKHFRKQQVNTKYSQNFAWKISPAHSAKALKITILGIFIRKIAKNSQNWWFWLQKNLQNFKEIHKSKFIP